MTRNDMKAEEIMIGDLLLCSYRDYLTKERKDFAFRVTQIPQNYGNEPQVWGESLDGRHRGNMGEVSRILPLPLTSEILEKNGFEECQYWHEYKSGNIIIQAALPNVRMKNGTKEFSTDDMRSVHELQHALRLCGIQKDIIL